MSIETHFAGKIFPGSREDILDYMASVGYKHFPTGHANNEWVRYTEEWEDVHFRIVNDLFVREDIAANLEVKKARTGERVEL
jgi:hypothetical protein